MTDCFGGFVAIFFGGFLNQITNYNRKKGTVVWDGQMTVSFFFGSNLIDKGRNPPKTIAHNYHFSKYEIW
jgi:hypothetical protein